MQPPFTTLSNIITKVRSLTGTGNSFQLLDSTIQNYINSFYLYDLPAQFRNLKLKDKYTFNTIQGQDTYPFDSEHYTTIEMPCYCAKREIALFQDPWSFYGVNFNWQNQEFFATGAGNAGPYTGTTQASPLLRSVNTDPGALGAPILTYPMSKVQNVLITANTATSSINVVDDGKGNLLEIFQMPTNPYQTDQFNQTFYRNIVGTINYFTGVISIASNSLSQNIPQGNQIQIQYNPEQLNIPISILFFQNQFTLRPVPDKGYTIELTAYRQPTAVLMQSLPTSSGNTAELNEWWELLAAGAAKKIFEDRSDPDGIVMMDKLLKERYQVAQDRVYGQLGKQRVNTIFADQLQYNYGQGAGFFGSV